MQFHPQNGWFLATEFQRACQAVGHAAGSSNFMHAKLWRCKYVQLYVDQRTGSFIFRDGAGEMLTHDEVYALYPSLRDEPATIVSAGVRPYPE